MSTPQNPDGGPGDPWSQQPGYPPPAYPQPGQAQPGQAQPGYPQPGYPQPGQAQPAYPVPAYPQAGYSGSYPAGQPQGYRQGPAAPVPRPQAVTVAFWLWMAIMVIGIVSSVLLLSSDYFDEVRSALQDAGLSGTSADLATGIGTNLMIVATIIVAVVTIFVYVFFGVMMLRGRNWSRIVLTVLGGLSVLSHVSGAGVATGADVDIVQPGSTVILGWVNVALAVAAIVAMYLRVSNQYFSAVKAQRAAASLTR